MLQMTWEKKAESEKEESIDLGVNKPLMRLSSRTKKLKNATFKLSHGMMILVAKLLQLTKTS